MMNDPEAADEYYREILRARSMSPDEKVREGFHLFEQGRERVAAIVRSHFPDAEEAAVKAIVDVAVRLVH
jgi:hypothetical protein